METEINQLLRVGGGTIDPLLVCQVYHRGQDSCKWFQGKMI